MADIRLARAHIEAQRRLRNLTRRGVEQNWRGLGGWDRGDVPRWLATTIPFVAAAQRQSVALTDAYFAQQMRRAPLGVDPSEILTRARPTPKDEVYRRPFVTLWAGLQAGKLWDAAFSDALTRATTIAETDVQLAMTHTTAEVTATDTRIVGYERVPNADACELCLLASTQRYHTGDLLPIHDNCLCGVSPLEGTEDPGQVIHPDRLAAIREEGIQERVEEHGELGPVLVSADHEFKGPDDF